MQSTILILFLLLSTSLYAQIEEDWVINHSSRIWSSEIDSEGNLVTVFDEMGSSRVLKFSPQGDTLWDKSSSSYLMSYLTVMIDNQDNIYLAGRKRDAAQGDELTALIVKLDSDGIQLWSKYLDVSNIPDFRTHNNVKDAQLDSAGNVYLLNEVSYNTSVQNGYRTIWYIYKCSPDGTFVWDYKHQGNVTNSQAYTYDFEVMPDGTIYAVGSINNVSQPSLDDFAIIKLSSSGSLQWERTFQYEDRGSGQFVTVNDNGTVLAGIYGGNNTKFVRCYSSSGSLLWSKTYNNNTELIYFTSLTTDHDGNFYVCGNKKSTSGVNNYIGLVLKYNAVTGERMRKCTLSYNYSSIAHSKIDNDNNLILSGLTSFDGGSNNGIFTTMFDEYGYEQWTHVYNSGNTDATFSLNCGDSGLTYISGYNYESGVGSTGQVIRYTIKKTIVPWISESGGSFSTAANWLGNEVPLDYETALYDSTNYGLTTKLAASPDAEVNVTFDQITTTGGLVVEKAQVNFDLQEHSFGVDKIYVGGDVELYNQSRLSVFNGVLGADVGDNSIGAIIGYNGYKGQLVVDLLSELVLTSDVEFLSSLIVGSEECEEDTAVVDYCGSIVVQNGGKLKTKSAIIGRDGSSGQVKIDGANSDWTDEGTIKVGESGTGSIDIDNRGDLNFKNIYLGQGSGSSGEIFINDGSVLLGDSLFVGVEGNGTVFINDHLTLDSTLRVITDHVHIGVEQDSYGEISLNGFGARLLTFESIFVGSNGTGSLLIQDSASVNSNTILLGSGDGFGSGYIHLSGEGSKLSSSYYSIAFSDSALMVVDNGATLKADLSLTLGFSPNSQGFLDIRGDLTTATVDSGSFNVGLEGHGELTVSDSARLYASSATTYVASDSGSTGEVTIEGDESVWFNDYSLTVGSFGNGGVSVLDGGRLLTNSMQIGEYAGGIGSLLIDGDSSLVVIDQDLGISLLDFGAVGIVRLTDGGELTVHGAINISQLGSLDVSGGSFSSSSLSCDSGGTFIDPSGAILIGGQPVPVSNKNGETKSVAASENYIDTLLIADGAVLDVSSIVLNAGGYLGVDGAYSFPVTNAGGINPGDSIGKIGSMNLTQDYTQESNGTLFVELADTNSFDKLLINGKANLSGILNIGLVNGYSPEIGTEFEFLLADSIDGNFENVVTTNGLTVTVNYSDTSVSLAIEAVSDIQDDFVIDLLPQSFALYQNYPNPFNPTTEIRFDLPRAESVRLELYNILGQKVETLANGRFSAGTHTISWDASSFSTGVYFYIIKAGEYTDSKKLILMK